MPQVPMFILIEWYHGFLPYETFIILVLLFLPSFVWSFLLVLVSLFGLFLSALIHPRSSLGRCRFNSEDTRISFPKCHLVACCLSYIMSVLKFGCRPTMWLLNCRADDWILLIPCRLDNPWAQNEPRNSLISPHVFLSGQARFLKKDQFGQRLLWVIMGSPLFRTMKMEFGTRGVGAGGQ